MGGAAELDDWIAEQAKGDRGVWCCYNNHIEAHAIYDALTLRAMVAQGLR